MTAYSVGTHSQTQLNSPIQCRRKHLSCDVSPYLSETDTAPGILRDFRFDFDFITFHQQKVSASLLNEDYHVDLTPVLQLENDKRLEREASAYDANLLRLLFHLCLRWCILWMGAYATTIGAKWKFRYKMS